MPKRDKLSTVWCNRCSGLHPEGEHLAKPKARKKILALVKQKIDESVKELVDIEAQKIMEGTSTIFPAGDVGDGVALVSAAHPIAAKKAKRAKKKVSPKRAKKAGKATAVDPVAGRAKRVTARGRAAAVGTVRPRSPATKSKATARALVAAEEDRKRALKTARQQRWRDKQKGKA